MLLPRFAPSSHPFPSINVCLGLKSIAGSEERPEYSLPFQLCPSMLDRTGHFSPAHSRWLGGVTFCHRLGWSVFSSRRAGAGLFLFRDLHTYGSSVALLLRLLRWGQGWLVADGRATKWCLPPRCFQIGPWGEEFKAAGNDGAKFWTGCIPLTKIPNPNACPPGTLTRLWRFSASLLFHLVMVVSEFSYTSRAELPCRQSFFRRSARLEFPARVHGSFSNFRLTAFSLYPFPPSSSLPPSPS